MVKVRLVVPPRGIEAAPKALMMIGGVTTARAAVENPRRRTETT
jgi:hypothetical protein